MKKPIVIVTSGGTREHIDDFRLITNISSGALGAKVVDHVFYHDVPWKVYHVYTRYSKTPTFFVPEYPSNNSNYIPIVVESASDAMNALEKIVPEADAIIHAMAVADFGFKRDKNIKLKSNDPEAFVEYLKKNIIVNPKIISNFRKWNKDIFIVGFKFEINKTIEELIDIAHDSLVRNDANIVIANDKKMMKLAKDHIAFAVDKNKSHITLNGKDSIASFLISMIESYMKGV